MNIDDIIENIKNDYYRKLINNIFNKLDDEEKYVILQLNKQLQDKINKIDKALEYIKENCIDDEFYINLTKKEKCIIKVLEILGDEDEKN